MKRVLHFSVRTLRRALILLIIGAALLIIAGHLLAPMAAQYRADVQQWTSEMLGQPATIGRLEGDWRGLGPELILHDLQLFNPQRQKPILYLREVRISFSLIDSLRRLEPVVRKVSFISPRLRIIRQKNGSIAIGNLSQLNELDPEDSSSAFLLPTHLSLVNGELIWEDLTTAAPPLQLTEVNLNLRNDLDRHQLNGSLSLPGSPTGRLELAIDLSGDLARNDWTARSYMKSEGIDLAYLLNRRAVQSYRFSNSRANIELWGEWDPQGLIGVEGTTDWEQVEITRTESTPEPRQHTLQLDRLSSALRLQQLPRGWQLDLTELRIQRSGRRWPMTRMGLVAEQNEAGDWRIAAGSGDFRLEDIEAIGTLFPLPSNEIESGLARLGASGGLRDLRLRFQQAADGNRWAASGEITDFNSQPWGGIPGIRNLPLRFWMDQEQGTIALEARDVTLDFDNLFRDPLHLQQLAGEMSWQRLPDGSITLSTDRLLAENADIHTLSRMRMEIPRQAEQSIQLDLQTDFWEGDASTTPRYLPTGIMGEEVVKWVDRSIGNGRVTRGSALVRGPLDDFPFAEQPSGRFEVFFNVQQLKLDYWPEWPALEELQADVRFLNRGFDAWASDGRILDSRVDSIHARIDDLTLTSPLKLTGAVEGPVQDNLRLLTESPLREDFGKLVGGIQAEGAGRLQLDFSLPIEEGSEFAMNGRLHFLDSTLRLKEWPLVVSGIRGDLQFDQDHIFADSITGQSYGVALTIDIDAPEQNRKATRISASATVPVATLRDQLPALGSLPMLAGSSRWQLDLDIPHLSAGPDAPVPIRLRSDLAGTRIELPAPLGKSKQAIRPLLLESQLDDDPQQRWQVRYHDLLDAALLIDHQDPKQPRLIRGGITLGGEKARLPGKDGLTINGWLAYLSLVPWLETLPTTGDPAGDSLPPLNQLSLTIDRLQLGETETERVRVQLDRQADHWQGEIDSRWAQGTLQLPLPGTGNGLLRARLKQLQFDPWLPLLAGSRPAAASNSPLRRISLGVDQLIVGQTPIKDFSLELENEAGDWRGQLSSDRFAGRIRVPANPLDNPVTLNLERLALTLDEASFEPSKTHRHEAGSRVDPTRIPALDLQVDQFSVNRQPFGPLQLTTHRQEGGLALQNLSLDTERLRLTAAGSWLQGTGSALSRLQLSLSSDDFGALLSDLELSDNLVGGPIKLNSRLNWSGAPMDFELDRLNGQLDLQVGEGRLLEMDPGVGRLFGLFNLGALRRRLTLDFSDIFRKGFTFDTIEGNFVLDNGDAYTNDFRMMGPSATIELSGRIGLGDEDFDALVSITPKLSSSLPLAGAIAGGPAVGAALFIAQQLVGDSLDRVTKIEYMATGSWDDPVLTPKVRERRQTGSEMDGPARFPDRPAPAPAPPPAAETPRPASPEAEERSETETGGNPFSRLLEKLKPTGPTYPPEPRGNQ